MVARSVEIHDSSNAVDPPRTATIKRIIVSTLSRSSSI
jgi:hypothetical protein